MASPLPPSSTPRQLPIQRLRAAIQDPQISAFAVTLVELAQRALADQQRLDETLYERFKGGDGALADDTSPDLLVRGLMAATFGGLRALVAFCQQARPSADAGSGDGEDFSFGDLEGAAAARPADDELDLGAGDIGDLLDGIDEHKQQSEA